MIPEFPKTRHLHQVDDSILLNKNLFVEEKVDGANCEDFGFAQIPLLHEGPITVEKLKKLCLQPATFSSSDQREGVYLKTGDDFYTIDRCKLLREGYTQGCNWNEEKIVKQKLNKV